MKICTKCKIPKEDIEFNKNILVKSGLYSWCRSCQNKRASNHYYSNPEHCTTISRKSKQKLNQWFYDYKETLKCERCGYNEYSIALDFHHKNPKEKEYNISVMIANMMKQDIVMKEIEKCIVLCANCHRVEHSKHTLLGKLE